MPHTHFGLSWPYYYAPDDPQLNAKAKAVCRAWWREALGITALPKEGKKK